MELMFCQPRFGYPKYYSYIYIRNLKTKTVMKESIGAILGVVAIGALIAVILALPTMLLWNSCLVPAINGVNEIGFFQALGIITLCYFLFWSTSLKNK